jgi:hypothetical protein
MRKGLLTLGLLIALAAPRVALAQLPFERQHVANEPASTLLLPYFEVQLPKKIGGKSTGITTIFSISNASASATLAHVTLWSDLAVPVTNFDVYLTGYDTLNINLFDVLNGHLPITASAGQDFHDTQDPHDGISNKGKISQDINFASCFGTLPYPDPIPVESIEHLRASLTGQPSALFSGKCAGRNLGDKKPIARGYVTVDVGNACNALAPSDPGYFSNGGGGLAGNRNIIFGDYAYINKSKKIGRGDALVHIGAPFFNDPQPVPGDYTFYGGYVQFTAIDGRQPLSTIFAGRFINVPKHPIFPTGTSVIAWRDTRTRQLPFTCGTTPAPFPLNQEQIVVFDEQENPEVPEIPPIPPFPASSIKPFTAAAQITKVGGPTFPVSTASGWIYMDLNTTIAGAVGPTDQSVNQGWVDMVLESKGKYSAQYRAATLDSADDVVHLIIPVN